MFRGMLDELCDLIRRGKLTAPACTEVGLGDYSKALDMAMQPFTSAKQVLIMWALTSQLKCYRREDIRLTNLALLVWTGFEGTQSSTLEIMRDKYTLKLSVLCLVHFLEEQKVNTLFCLKLSHLKEANTSHLQHLLFELSAVEIIPWLKVKHTFASAAVVPVCW